MIISNRSLVVYFLIIAFPEVSSSPTQFSRSVINIDYDSVQFFINFFPRF